MRKKAHVLTILAAITAFVTGAVFVLAGCNVSADWVRDTIEGNYYCFDGDYSSVSDLAGLSIEEMMARLDKYSAYYTREQYEAVLAGNAGSKSGIGVSYSFTDGEGVVVRSVVGNSPAKIAGLKAGDVVVSASAGGETVQFNELNDFSSFVTARDTGENITLNLKYGGSVTLAKAEYTASYVSMYTKYCAYEIVYDGETRSIAEDKEGRIAQLPDGAAYIYLSQFYGNAAEEMGELISIFNQKGCTSLILDLRDNGGGYVKVMNKIGGRFTSSLNLTDEAISLEAEYKSGRREVEYCANYANSDYLVPAGTDVYVMANHNTASASEALIGVLVSYNILEYENIFLSDYRSISAYADSLPRSYGKGIMQSTFRNALTKEALTLTVAGIYWQNGKTIHGKGLTPEDGCSTALAGDDIVNVGYDDELVYVIEKILADRG